MSEKFDLMNEESILRDDKCISIANVLQAAKKGSGPEMVVVKTHGVEASSLVLTIAQRGTVVVESRPGKVTLADVRALKGSNRGKLRYSDEFSHRKNIKRAVLTGGRLVLHT